MLVWERKEYWWEAGCDWSMRESVPVYQEVFDIYIYFKLLFHFSITSRSSSVLKLYCWLNIYIYIYIYIYIIYMSKEGKGWGKIYKSKYN